MKLQKFNRPFEDVSVIVESLNSHKSGQALSTTLNNPNRFALEIIIKRYCESQEPQNNTVGYLTGYCLTKPYYPQYSTNRVRWCDGGDTQIESKISEMIEQISSDMMALLLRRGDWEKNDYVMINNVCSKLHSIHRLVKYIGQFGEKGSMSGVLDMIEAAWEDMIYFIIDDFVHKIGQHQIDNESIEYQNLNRDINENHENKYVIKYTKKCRIDTKPIYHYYKIKLGSGVPEKMIENKIINLITTIVHQKTYNKSQFIELLHREIAK